MVYIMKTEREFLDELVVRHHRVKNLIPAIEAAIDAMYQSYLNGGTMLFVETVVVLQIASIS